MYRIRFFRIILKCFFSKPKNLFDRFNLYFISIPFLDTDVTRFFTQTYSSIAALGRWDFLFSSEFKKAALKNNWLPVTLAETIHFQKSIRNFNIVHLQTELICWNENFFYLKQTFFVKEKIYAVAYTEGLLRGPKGHLNPVQAFEVVGDHRKSPPVPKEIQDWHNLRNMK